MIILLIFSFLAGFVTVISPCILPLLPAILAAGSGKGPYRPLGVIVGFCISFIFFTLALTTLVQSFGLSALFLRNVAIAIIAFFGIVLLFPSLSDWFSAKTSAIADRGGDIQTKSTKDGYWSGVILGLSLGLVWTPCAGPILAAVTTLVATQRISFETVLITIFYTLGSAIPMFFIAYGGKVALSASGFLRRHSERIRQGFGVLMIATAFAIAFDLHIWFEQKVVEYLPVLQIENNPLVQEEIQKLRQQNRPSAFSFTETKEGTLPKIAAAPEIVGIDQWLNSNPLTIKDLKGKVVLIDFWTYSCINCLRTLPYLTRWYDTYKDQGFVIIGVHTPEFEFEKQASNVQMAIEKYGIHYPVPLDNHYKTWENYSNNYWPAHYLIDRDGYVRSVHFGEGAYVETENNIRKLLGMTPLIMEEKPVISRPITPETYLGYGRAESYPYSLKLVHNEPTNYVHDVPPRDDQFILKGPWNVQKEYIESTGSGSILELNFIATNVYLVLGGKSEDPISVLIDGKPLPKEWMTKDMVREGEIIVKEARKYDIVNLNGQYGRHILTLQVPQGIRVYAFTFGDE